MNISNTGGVGETQPVQPIRPKSAAGKAYEAQAQPSVSKPDEAEISDQARLFQKISSAPEVREDKVAELKKLIESGEYETDERIQGAIKRLIEESF